MRYKSQSQLKTIHLIEGSDLKLAVSHVCMKYKDAEGSQVV